MTPKRPGLPAGLLALVFLAPAAVAALALLRAAFTRAGAPSLHHFVTLAHEPYLFARPLAATLLLAGAVALAATLLGTLLALLLAADPPGRAWLAALLPLPHILPSFQLASAWVVIFSHNGIAAALSGVQGLLPAYGAVPVFLVLALHLYLPAYLAVAGGLAQLDPAYEEAARLAGLPARTVLLRVTLPLLRPALLSGFLVSFAFTLEEFGAPSLLGQPTGFSTLTVQIYQLLTTPPLAFGDAAALSVVLGLLALGVLIANLRLLGRGVAATFGGRAARPAPRRLGRMRWPAALLGWGFLLMTALGPLLALGVVSLLGAWGRGFGPANWTGVRYAALLHSVELRRALLNSAWLAVAAAALCAVLGLAATLGRGALSRVLDPAGFVALSLPGMVLGLALILAFAGGILPLYGTGAILLLAYMLRFTGISARASAAGIARLPAELADAGRVGGLAPRQVLRRITLPLLRPAIASGAALVAVNAVKEISATSLLASEGHETLAYEAYLRFMEGDYTEGAAVSIVMIALSLAIFALAAWAGSARFERKGG
jgi:iron(III) transport system permease protein